MNELEEINFFACLVNLFFEKRYGFLKSNNLLIRALTRIGGTAPCCNALRRTLSPLYSSLAPEYSLVALHPSLLLRFNPVLHKFVVFAAKNIDIFRSLQGKSHSATVDHEPQPLLWPTSVI